MTSETVERKVYDLEFLMRGLLNEFNQSTGYMVTNIYLDTIDVNEMGRREPITLISNFGLTVINTDKSSWTRAEASEMMKDKKEHLEFQLQGLIGRFHSETEAKILGFSIVIEKVRDIMRFREVDTIKELNILIAT